MNCKKCDMTHTVAAEHMLYSEGPYLNKTSFLHPYSTIHSVQENCGGWVLYIKNIDS